MSSNCVSRTATSWRCSACRPRFDGTGDIPMRRPVEEALRMSFEQDLHW